MKILTTSDLDSVSGGLAPLIPITWAVVADTGFASAVAGAWAVGWGIGTLVENNVDTYSTNANGQNPGVSSGTCRPEPTPPDDNNNCDATGSCY